MSEENTEKSDKSAKQPAKRAAKRARKSAKEKPQPQDRAADSAPVNEAPPAEATFAIAPEAPAQDNSNKRPKRRRGGKKNKGAGGESQDRHEAPESAAQEPSSLEEPTREDSRPRGTSQEPRNPKPPRPPRHDAEDLARKAWKIYLAEVSEEGIALINDQDAREIARRCFRMAEHFLDEQARHR